MRLPGAAGSTVTTRRRRPERGSCRPPTGGSAGPAGRCARLHVATLVFLAGHRPRAAPVDAQVVDHADPGHAAPADGAVAERLRPVAVRDRLEPRPHRPLPARTRVVIAFGSWAVQIVVATTAGFALSVLRPRVQRGPDRARHRDPVRAADRAAGAAVPDGRRRPDRALAADRLATGRSGCRPAPAR